MKVFTNCKLKKSQNEKKLGRMKPKPMASTLLWWLSLVSTLGLVVITL